MIVPLKKVKEEVIRGMRDGKEAGRASIKFDDLKL
jgi:hypothetical protein